MRMDNVKKANIYKQLSFVIFFFEAGRKPRSELSGLGSHLLF